jgi:prepilin-type N-terminal cleavage/methylation domain-containing protein
MPISSAGNTERGVTLIELVVVVGIVGIVLAVLSPSMAAGLDSVRMASATDNVATFLNAAVNRAERHQQPVALMISIPENKLAMYSNEAGFVREMPMPPGIAIEAVFPRDENEPEAIRRLILMPGASVPAIGVQLINSHQNRRIVRLDPMTGFPRIETPTAQ